MTQVVLQNLYNEVVTYVDLPAGALVTLASHEFIKFNTNGVMGSRLLFSLNSGATWQPAQIGVESALLPGTGPVQLLADNVARCAVTAFSYVSAGDSFGRELDENAGGAAAFTDLTDAPALVESSLLGVSPAGALECRSGALFRDPVNNFDDDNADFTVPIDVSGSPYTVSPAVVGSYIIAAETSGPASSGIWEVVSLAGSMATVARRSDMAVGSIVRAGELIPGINPSSVSDYYVLVVQDPDTSAAKVSGVVGTDYLLFMRLGEVLSPQIQLAGYFQDKAVGTPAEGNVIKWVSGVPTWVAP